MRPIICLRLYRGREGMHLGARDHHSLLHRLGIVDDEPLARRGVGECATRDDAVLAIRQAQPDLVLLDVQLGRVTGFEVIERVGAESMPLVVFVTAYDRHALRAIEVHAVDYVLKPVDPDRLRDAIDRATRLRTLERGASLVERLERLLAGQAEQQRTPAAPAVLPGRIAVSHGERRSFVDVPDVDWVEAYGNYVRIHTGGRAHLVRSTISRMEHRFGAENAGA